VTFLLTAIALVAFASNSILCRLALGAHEIDVASFTTARIVSGAVTLLLLRAATASRRRRADVPNVSWIAAGLLFMYAAPFSFAYIALGAGTGALILFACVQATMLIGATRSGERFHWRERVGLVIALAGLVYLVSPALHASISAPRPFGSVLMAVAGVAWGLYSLRGRGSTDPLGDTTNNFVWAVPLAFFLILVAWPTVHLSPRGLALAVASGALASGLGYTIWFAALRRLTAIRAATVQLTVPVIAAVGGLLLLHETITARLVLSAALILGGVGLALAGRYHK